jgi:hypothetical protein
MVQIEEEGMSNQLQCPNCGGYKVTSQIGSITKSFPLTWEQRSRRIGCSMVLTGVLGVVLQNSLSNGKIIISLIVGMLILISFLVLLFLVFERTRTIVVGKSYTSTCLLCGYQWQWLEGQPRTDVNVKPDLIAMGAKRLEEEERQRQEEIEAQQRRKEEREEAKLRKQNKEIRDLKDKGMW